MRDLEIHKALVEAGIPIDGVSIDQRGAGNNIVVQFRGATKEQQDAAAVIVDAFKTARPRRPKSIAALVVEIGNLTAADRNKLFAVVAADWLIDHPAGARKLSIALDGDEEA